MDIRVNQGSDHISIAIEGEIDEYGSELLERQYKALNTSGIKEVVIDLDGVTHIGSAGIGRLLLIYKDTAIARIDARLINVPDNIFNLLKLVKLDTVFKIEKKR